MVDGFQRDTRNEGLFRLQEMSPYSIPAEVNLLYPRNLGKKMKIGNILRFWAVRKFSTSFFIEADFTEVKTKNGIKYLNYSTLQNRCKGR
jgi:hypothetical protein